MSCGDENCPGCIMESAVKKLREQGMDVEDILTLFGFTMQQEFPIEVITEELPSGVIH